MPSPNANIALIKALNVTSPCKSKGISTIGSYISAFLTDDDYLNLIKVSREFVKAYNNKKQFRIEDGLIICNSAKPFFEFRMSNQCIYTDAWRLSRSEFYINAMCVYPVINILMAPIEAYAGFIITLGNCLVISSEYLCCKITPTTQRKKDCAEGCYCMLCGPFLRRNMLAIGCCYGYAKGVVKDTCCSPYRSLEQVEYVGIFSPSKARKCMFKNSVCMVRDDSKMELPGVVSLLK